MRCENLIFEFERGSQRASRRRRRLRSDHVTAAHSNSSSTRRAFPWTYCHAGYHLHILESESRAAKWMEAGEEGEVVRG